MIWTSQCLSHIFTSINSSLNSMITCFAAAVQLLSLCDPMDCTTTGFPVLHYLLEFVQTRVHWVNDAIQPSVVPFSPCPQSSPASGSVPVSWLFASAGQSIRASALASVLPMNIRGWFPLGLTGWSSCCSRDSQEFSPAPQFESINSSALKLPCGPTPISISVHDYWKNHNFDYTNICW